MSDALLPAERQDEATGACVGDGVPCTSTAGTVAIARPTALAPA